MVRINGSEYTNNVKSSTTKKVEDDRAGTEIFIEPADSKVTHKDQRSTGVPGNHEL